MLDAATLVQPHAAAIIDALVQALDSPDGRDRLRAAKLLLLWGWGSPAGKRRGPERAERGFAGELSAAEQQRALDVLLPHIRPEPKRPNPAATSCPARHAAAGRPQKAPPLESATNPMSSERGAAPPKNTPLAEPALTPCPAAPADAALPSSPNPSANPMSRKRSPSPLAAPIGDESSRRDADPMSRALWPARHSDDAFRRRLPLPAPVEPPWPHDLAPWPPRRQNRWR